MPFYEYQCRACGAQVEVLQKITDAPLKKCPECGKNQLQKLVSAPVFRLAGGGWYETDFKTDKDKKRNLVDSDGGESKSEPAPDAKPEAKAEPKGEAKAEPKSAAGAAPRAGRKPVASPAKGSKPAPARKPAPRAKATTRKKRG